MKSAILQGVLWLSVLAISISALFYLMFGMEEAQTVMQQVVIATQAIGYAVIPYCIARSVEKLVSLDKGSKLL